MPSREVLYEVHSTRVLAPRDAVWTEIAAIDLVLSHLEQVTRIRPTDDRTSADLSGRIKWGPFGWNVNGSARVVDADRPDRLRFVVEFPALEAEQRGTFELTTVSSTETNLHLAAEFDLGRLATKIRSVVDLTAERYVRSIVDGTKAQAEHHWQAQQRLANRDSHADGS